MANITFVRIDTRLIHGQIFLAWGAYAKAKTLYAVDREISKNKFMKSLYKNAIPSGIDTVEIFSPEDFVSAYENNELVDGNAMLIFKDVKNLYETWKLNFPIKEVNIGNQTMKPDKVKIFKEVFFTKEEYQMLKEMNDSGIHIFIQIIPAQPSYEFDFITSKMK